MSHTTTHTCDLRQRDVLNGTITRCGCGQAWTYNNGWQPINRRRHPRLMRALYPRGWRTTTNAG